MAGELTDLIEAVVTADPVAREISRAARIDERMGALAQQTNTAVSQTIQSYITGLDLGVGTGTTDISVTSGAAYIPGLDKVVEYAGSTSIPTSMAAIRRWYVYLYENAGVGAITVSGNKPSDRYAGTARTQGGGAPDDTRRYLGFINNTQVPAVRKFENEGNIMFYTDALNNTVVLGTIGGSGGGATTNTIIDLSNFIPPHVQLVWVVGTFYNFVNASIHKAWIGHPTDGTSPSGGSGQIFMEASTAAPMGNYSGWIRCDSSSQLRYANSLAGLETFLWVRGFVDAR